MHEAGYPLSAKVRILTPQPRQWYHWYAELSRAEAHRRFPHVGYRARWKPEFSDRGQLQGLVTTERLAYVAAVAVDDGLRISQEADQLFFGGQLDYDATSMWLTGAIPGGCRLK